MIDNLILRLKYFQILTLFWLITLSSGCLQQIFWMVGHRVSLQHTNHVQVLGLESIFQNINAFKEFLFSECATPSTIWRSPGRKRITAGARTFTFTFEISILWRESITDPKVFTFIFSGKVCLYLVENRTTRIIQQPQTWFRFWFVVVHQLCSLVNDIYFWSIWCNHFQILSITTFREELFQFWDPEQCKARQYEGMEGVQDWMDYDDDEDEDDDDYNLGLYWDIWFALWSSLWWQS